jgi:hypothetical protein
VALPARRGQCPDRGSAMAKLELTVDTAQRVWG